MSVFRVKLNNTRQGLLDLDPSTARSAYGQGAVYTYPLGTQMSSSKQRGVYVMGPNRINRLLMDGETFSDCNYWKQFAYPQVSYEDAFIEVVTDDGSVWSSIASENVFPKVYDLSIDGGTTFSDTDNVADILGDTGGYAVFAQITNKEGAMGTDLRMRLNGNSDAVMDLLANSTQVFNAGDLAITEIAFENTNSGGGAVDVQIVVSVRSVANS